MNLGVGILSLLMAIIGAVGLFKTFPKKDPIIPLFFLFVVIIESILAGLNFECFIRSFL